MIVYFPATPVGKEVLMKAFRGRPSIMINRREEEKKAELAIQSLRLSFGGVIAVKDVDFKVHTGELMAVIGPNGERRSIASHGGPARRVPKRGRAETPQKQRSLPLPACWPCASRRMARLLSMSMKGV